MRGSKQLQSIGSPLASMALLVEVVLQELDELELRIDEPGLARVRVAARQLGRSLERLRRVAVDAGSSARDERSTCRVDINEALEFALQLAGHELRARATTLTSFGSPPLVDGSKSRLSQAFVSLLLQTARLIPPGRSRETVVRVSTRRHHLGSAAVDVDVSGSRLCWAEFPDPSDVNAGRIADSLGLAVCHRTVQELGGRLMVSCEPGAGAWFRVRLPASAS